MKTDEEMILRDTVIEVDLDRIAGNMRAIKEMAGEHTAVAAVVKADGYGHGAVGIAKTLMENGASLLAVATLSEAIELKKADPEYPVLIMGLTPDRLLSVVADYGIIQTIDTLHQAEILNQLASERKKKAVIHIKLDTGFHRLGFPDTEDGVSDIAKVCRLPWIEAEGIYTHLVLKDDESNWEQFARFTKVLEKLEREDCHFRYRHIADSIASVDYPEYRMDMIRAGAIIYGLKGFHKGQLDIRQALTFKTKISHISEVKKGEGVSYDFMWTAEKDTRVGTLPFGYADGYPRNLYGKGRVTIRGKQVPVIGVICMDQCMADLSEVPEAQIGDEVIIYGDGSRETMSVQEVSTLAGTNKNEIVSRLTRRSPRIYTHGDNAIDGETGSCHGAD